MNQDKVHWVCYQSRIQSCELLAKLLDEHKIECETLHELCQHEYPDLKLSKLSDKSLLAIEKDQLILLSRLEMEAFMHITELKKIARILKYRRKPITKD